MSHCQSVVHIVHFQPSNPSCVSCLHAQPLRSPRTARLPLNDWVSWIVGPGTCRWSWACLHAYPRWAKTLTIASSHTLVRVLRDWDEMRPTTENSRTLGLNYGNSLPVCDRPVESSAYVLAYHRCSAVDEVVIRFDMAAVPRSHERTYAPHRHQNTPHDLTCTLRERSDLATPWPAQRQQFM